MCSSNIAPSSSLFNRTAVAASILRRPNRLSTLVSLSSFLRSKNPSLLRLSASLTDSHLDLSWFSPDQSPSADSDDDFNGWAVVAAPPLNVKKKGVSAILIGGTCLAVVLVAIGCFSVSRRGFKLRFHSPLSSLDGVVSPIQTGNDKTESNDENAAMSGTSPEIMPHVPGETVPSEKFESAKVSIPVDSTQLEALSILKKLKIVEDDVRADELCTRREYARWLVRLNSLLERNPKHRIVPSVSLSGSVIAAFDDVGVEDPDFESIQALAEAGIISSKLLGENSFSDSSKGDGTSYFYPERAVCRKDLINWKTQLEYACWPGTAEQMSKVKIDYMDVKEINSDASPELFIDMLAGDNSIIRKVFGWSMRFQPNKPSTKAQAAVALTSGRMAEAVYNEILRLEAEISSRLAVMKEIKSELLDRGDIQRVWDGKLNEERTRGFELDNLYTTTVNDLEQEKILQVKTAEEVVKEKAAMDCQRQLLLSLKDEVDEMSDRLASERTIYVAEQLELQKSLAELQTKQEGYLDTRSILEAEIEALRILRSWVEDEARKSQARAKVLEEVQRRWKWEN